MSFNLKDKAATWDATYVFPRPANEQYLSSYKAFLRITKDGWKGLIAIFFAACSTAVLVYIISYVHGTFGLSYIEGFGFLVAAAGLFSAFVVWLICALDISKIMLPYRLEFQRESHGGRTWATRKELMESDDSALLSSTDNIEGKGVFLAPFKHHFSAFGDPEPKYQVFLSLKRLAQAMIIFGPPGSGKSSTFFIPVIRQFAACGGAIVLDVKGELYNYCAHYYSNVYRLDVMNPLFSDWFDLFGSCYRNPDLARRIAAYMVGSDSNKSQSKDPFWEQSALSLLGVMILFLCEMKSHPTPRDILRFLAENPKTAVRQKTDDRGKPLFAENGNPKMESYSPLNLAFAKCPYSFVRDLWTAKFAEMPQDTFGGVKANADKAIDQLLSPKINEILRPPTAEERKKGRRRIDFTDLRQMFKFDQNGTKRGTAVHIVVSPSDAMNMDTFLRVVFSVALDTLRESAQEGCNVLVALDEAGNVPLSKLPEGINTDRSKGICYFLGYQDRNQPLAQYGHESAKTFLGTAGINIFLPGVDDDTAEIASKRLGETTILQRSSSDAKNDGLDSEKVSEAGRKLMMPQDLTTQKWFTQCVITIKGLAPIRTKIPNDAKIQDIRISKPQRIVNHVSDEVLRLLNFKTGRESESVVKKVESVIVAPIIRKDADQEIAGKREAEILAANSPNTSADSAVENAAPKSAEDFLSIETVQNGSAENDLSGESADGIQEDQPNFADENAADSPAELFVKETLSPTAPVDLQIAPVEAAPVDDDAPVADDADKTQNAVLTMPSQKTRKSGKSTGKFYESEDAGEGLKNFQAR